MTRRRNWNSIEGPKLTRFKEAYLRMARNARYRPNAPGDGLGNIGLSAEDLRDPVRLDEEAVAYAEKFCTEEDKDTFNIGCSDFETNRAFVWTIEAARCLAAGIFGKPIARKLLEMALTDVEGGSAARDEPTVVTVPAAPGWYVLAHYRGIDYLTDDPVVAWEITRFKPRHERREPIRRYLLPVSTNGDLAANVGTLDGWLLRDPAGRYYQWGSSGFKFDTAENALAYLMSQRAQKGGLRLVTATTPKPAQMKVPFEQL